jgi:arylsulfatase A-like enzyme
MNILWIQTDEQSTHSLGCYGNHLNPTPNLDALARRGTC